MDVLRRVEREVELETTRGVPTRGSRRRRISRRRRRGRGSRGRSRRRGSRDSVIIVTAAALQLDDDRPEERRQGEGLQQLHRFEKARAGRGPNSSRSVTLVLLPSSPTEVALSLLSRPRNPACIRTGTDALPALYTIRRCGLPAGSARCDQQTERTRERQ